MQNYKKCLLFVRLIFIKTKECFVIYYNPINSSVILLAAKVRIIYSITMLKIILLTNTDVLFTKNKENIKKESVKENDWLLINYKPIYQRAYFSAGWSVVVVQYGFWYNGDWSTDAWSEAVSKNWRIGSGSR